VVSVEIAEISPIENALNDVEEKTKELAAMSVKYSALAKTGQNVSTNPLTMILNSVVDTPTDAGIKSYRNVFFDPDYIARHPERVDLLGKLRQAIDEQASSGA
jgi:dedicator of cytokinesis protein 3